MTWSVIDTNVLAVANGAHENAGDECIVACIDALLQARTDGVLVDEGREIFEQYGRNASLRGQPGVGDAFWKWLWDNQANESVCIQIPLDWIGPEPTDYAQFPADPRLAGFDRSDRVFVAVAIASGMPHAVLNASDTDWWPVRDVLAGYNVHVTFLCPELMT
jgi:hypothetical protein